MGFVLAPIAAYAQAPVSAKPAAVATTAQADPDVDKKLALAKKMHKLRPTKDQVYAAIDQIAQTQPVAQRDTFVQAMRGVLNYQAIEKISIDAMAETYTLPELQAMVDYYSKPEAISAAAKDQAYGQKVYPEIMRMLDAAMMKVRTGGGAAGSRGALGQSRRFGKAII